MAASLHAQTADLPAHDITSCNKCHTLLKSPKTLPCMHSYCAACLEEKVTTSKKSIACLVCSQEFDLPANGIDGLKPLAIVERLAGQKDARERLMTSESISCTACDESIQYEKTDTSSVTPDAVARCTECEDYLCTRCVAIHRSQRRMKNHPIFTLDELRTGKVSPIGSSDEQKICAKHKGEALLFYCDTCEEPICRQCVVVAHRHPDHKQVELEEAAKDRMDTLRQLQSACENNVNEVGKAIDEIGRVKRECSLAVSEARDRIRETAENAKTLFMQRLEEARKITDDELDRIDQEQQQTVKATENHLLSMKSRISAATMISKTLIDNGSDYEVTSAYSTLQTTLNDLSIVKTDNGNIKLKKVTFEPNTQICPDKITAGCVTGGSREMKASRPREMKTSTVLKEFRHSGNDLKTAFDMCVTSAGNIAVTDFSTGKVNVFTNDSTLKLSFNVNTGVDATGLCNPWCIRVGSNGLFYVTDYNSPFVRIFDIKGTYTRSFHTVSPENVSYFTSGSSALYGLCFDSEDNVLVGNVTHHFISRHSLDGTHLSSIKVGLAPYFLAVTPTDQIVISSYCNSNVKILDGEGNVLVNVIKPNHVASWYPAGVVTGRIYYCNDDVEEQELFIADRNNGHAVYRYTVTGKYVNSVTTAVSDVYGLALSEDEKHLYVACTSSVKCFDI